MILRSMRETDHLFWFPRLKAEYINDKMRANGLTYKEAEQQASESLSQILPYGLQTRDHHFFVAEENEVIVGYAWIFLRPLGGEIQSYIFDIIIEEAHQRKGYGRKLMLALEDESKKRGASRLALHVFGFNQRAIALYQSLGFETTNLSMEKRL